VDLTALGMHETVEVEPLVTPAKGCLGSLSPRCPHHPHHRLQAQPHLVLGPHLNLRARMLLLDLPQPLGKLFLKASCFSVSAPALEGRGTCGVCPSLLAEALRRLRLPRVGGSLSRGGRALGRSGGRRPSPRGSWARCSCGRCDGWLRPSSRSSRSCFFVSPRYWRDCTRRRLGPKGGAHRQLLDLTACRRPV
jgi:hypothetical protein